MAESQTQAKGGFVTDPDLTSGVPAAGCCGEPASTAAAEQASSCCGEPAAAEPTTNQASSCCGEPVAVVAPETAEADSAAVEAKANKGCCG